MLGPDESQEKAIASGARTIIVSGGPGTGKTQLVTRRFAHLVSSGHVPLSSILVLAFSSASAARLRRLIEQTLGASYDELWVHTYHSFANFVLTEYASEVNPSKQPRLLSPFAEYLLVKELLRQEHTNLNRKFGAIASKDGLAREVSDFFGLLKQNLAGPERFKAIARGLTPELNDLARLYSVYERNLRERFQVGFRDAVSRVLEIFEAEPGLLKRYTGKFSHIFVDEFEEIDPGQLRLLEILACETTSLFVAGDQNQRIFRFRGSSIGQFAQIAQARKEAEEIRLEKTYRLPPELVKASENLIAHNRETKPRAASVKLGKEMNIARYKDAIEQAYAIARDIKCKVLDGTSAIPPISFSDFAVICRSTSRSAIAFQEAFSYYRMPYILYNAASFHSHPMVRTIADFVRLIENPEDDGILLNVLNAPALGLDAVKLRKLANSSPSIGSTHLYEIIRRAVTKGCRDELNILDEETAAGLREFVTFFEHLRDRAGSTNCPSALVHSIMKRFFYKDILDRGDITSGVRDARNLRLLYDVVTDIEQVIIETRGKCGLSDVAEYMEHAFAHFSSQMESDPADESAAGIRIMTAHQTKGMEFPFVFMVDMTDEYFPSFSRRGCLLDGKSLDELAESFRKGSGEKGLPGPDFGLFLSLKEQLREERQLAYVAATRSTKQITLCFTEESHFAEPVEPSPFIGELIGRDLEDASIERPDPQEARDAGRLLTSALSNQEIESALRACIHTRSREIDNLDDLFKFFESLGLDANFVLSKSPFEPEPPEPPQLIGHRYSASQLSAYLACPRLFFFEKILKIAPERPEDFGLGRLIHLVLQEFHRKVKRFSENARKLEEDLMESLRKIWKGADGHLEPFFSQFPTTLQQAAIERRAEEILRRYLRTEVNQTDGSEIVACETFVEFAVRDHLFVARIDRIDRCADGSHRIIDYKTSSSGPMGAATIKKRFLNIEGKEDYVPADFQLPLYLLAGRCAGYNPVELFYYWVSQQDSSGMFKKSSLRVCDDSADCLSAADMLKVEESIEGVISRIIAGDFRPDPKSSFECARCSFGFVCNADEEEDAVNND